jgi:hypothetical protein
MSERLPQLAAASLRRDYVDNGSFVYVEDFLPANVTARLIAAVAAVESAVNRNYLPGHKQGGSVSRHTLDELAPFIAELYRSPPLIAWLSEIAGEAIQVSPPEDAHAYAFYFYTKEGDHIGWHYDNSYYKGRRYTLLLGVVDDSSCRLEYELHTREPEVPTERGSIRYPPGSMVFFDGDKLKHRITPAHEGDRRVSLTFEYVTDPGMHPFWRMISNFKDAVAYFGLRQVFGRKRARS